MTPETEQVRRRSNGTVDIDYYYRNHSLMLHREAMANAPAVMEMTMMAFLICMLKFFGVIFLRFRPVPRLWCVWLVGINAACLLFITHTEAQVVLAVTAIVVAGQS